jgi:hypothetical protein
MQLQLKPPLPRHVQPTIQSLTTESIATTSKQDSTSIASSDKTIRLAELETRLQSIHPEYISMQSGHQIPRADFQKVISGVLKHSNEIQAIQSDIPSLSTTIKEICNDVLPNSTHIPSRSTFPSIHIYDDLSSLTSVPIRMNYPSSPHRKKINRGVDQASPSDILMTGDSQIELGISSSSIKFDMNATIGIYQY